MSVDEGQAVVMTDGERTFVEGIAEHWHVVDGVTREQGRMIGWMAICDPPEQTVAQICEAVDAQPEQIQPMLVHFVEAGMYEEIERPGEEPLVRMPHDGYPRVVAQTFASWPLFQETLRSGLEVLDEMGASAERRQRVAEVESLYRSVVADMGKIMSGWERREKSTV
ncbi:hypothetical protein ACHZ98_32275 [Streptomyces sp. MAR4 CNY-716]